MGDFKLAASLEGHDDDVRDVAFPRSSFVLSASRDATVRVWKNGRSNPPLFEGSIVSHGTAFVNSVAYVPPTTTYPDGLFISGGKDTVIEVREPGKPPDANAERLLLGHEHNVCTLDVSPDLRWLVSGSWDGSARVWSLEKWDCEAILEGHDASVWCVLAYNKDTIITASADKLIRIFSLNGKLLKSIRGNTDVVRALCKITNSQGSRADFASAGNDGLIRLWRMDGTQVGTLSGHDSFIYSLCCLPNGELVSSGEDRTVRIWKGEQCVQTITHPAISVWAVAVCMESGDIVSGASDRVVRVFTRSEERQADPQALKAFENSVKSSSIPRQQMGDINKEKLHGPEFLTQKSGTKEGQVVMIREANGSVSAHTWSSAANQWINVGTVVDSAGSSGKKTEYLGKDYDYVFDVDIEDGKPPLKLPFNLSQNPYEAATGFLENNNLPATYLDQVAKFITKNTQGATIGQSSQSQPAPQGFDPWGTESRYRPGDQGQTGPNSPSVRQQILPQKQYLSIKTANLKTIQKKIEELNNQLISAGSKGLSLNPPQIEAIQRAIANLERTPPSPTGMMDGVDAIFYIVSSWPPENRLPGLDILRLLTAVSIEIATPTLLSTLSTSGVFTDSERPNNQMLAIRAIANLFETAEGRKLIDSNFDKINSMIQPFAVEAANRNISIALATTYINFAVLLSEESYKDLPSSIDRALTILDGLSKVLKGEKDSEVSYRALVALGTLLMLGDDVQSAAHDIYRIEDSLKEIESRVQEPRMKGIAIEIRGLLA